MGLVSNPTVDAVDAIIHGVIMEVAYNLALTAATAELPWLNLPIIHPLFKYLLRKAFSYADVATEQAAAFSIIDAQTSHESSAYKDAVSALHTAQASGNAEAIAYATQNFKQTLAILIRT